jgi:hypothetical protein
MHALLGCQGCIGGVGCRGVRVEARKARSTARRRLARAAKRSWVDAAEYNDAGINRLLKNYLRWQYCVKNGLKMLIYNP